MSVTLKSPRSGLAMTWKRQDSKQIIHHGHSAGTAPAPNRSGSTVNRLPDTSERCSARRLNGSSMRFSWKKVFSTRASSRGVSSSQYAVRHSRGHSSNSGCCWCVGGELVHLLNPFLCQELCEEYILYVTKNRVKPVTPGRGLGRKRPPTPKELELIDKVHGGGGQ